MKTKSLEGLTVLELSQYISAPYVGQTLADFGADVYKIESPGKDKGDVARKYDPIYNDMSLYFASYNRNKKFITLDLKSELGKEMFLKMVKKSDVVLQNFKPGVMERLGLSYDNLKTVNPGIILASISGFGQKGPYADLPALDMTIQARSGFMDFTGFPDGPPTKAGPPISDFFGALYTVIGILTALQYRNKTGLGQHVDVALFDAMFVMMENFPAIFHTSGELPMRSGNGRPFSAVCGTFQAQDGRMVQISATENGHFKKLMTLVGRPDLVEQPGMETSASRKKQESVINKTIESWISTKTSEEAADELKKSGIPNAIVQTVEQVLNDSLVQYREMLIRLNNSVLGDVPLIGNPIKLSESPAVYVKSAESRGADNERAYIELLDLTSEQIKQLAIEKII